MTRRCLLRAPCLWLRLSSCQSLPPECVGKPAFSRLPSGALVLAQALAWPLASRPLSLGHLLLPGSGSRPAID